MDRMLVGVQGVGAYLDDIIIAGADEAEHDRRLQQVLRRITEYGFRVKKEKCLWKVPSVEYLGFVLDGDRLHVNPKKTEAITSMQPPKNVSQLRSFLGMVMHYGKFLPKLSDQLAPLHQLLKKDANDKSIKYKWSAACQDAFERIKHDLSSPLMLSHYQPELPIVLAADASSKGIGAVLLHRLPDGKELPIAHASKSLTPTKKRYPQIEKEALALIFGVRKFHQFIWGRHFLLQTDHQPLVRIFGSKKGLPTTAANRLQNYGIILMGYSFDIEYVNTSKFGKADGLSRLPLVNDDDVQPLIKKIDSGLSETYTKTFANLPIQADQVRAATASDPIFQAVMTLHRKGWPEKLTPTFKVQASTVAADSLTPYFRIRHELAIANDCLLWGLRVLIPTSLRPRILAQLHDTHPGQTAMKRLARQRFWWLGMGKEIEKKTAQCDACKRMLTKTSKVPLQPWLAAQRPFQRLHINFAGPYLDAMWLIVVNAYSKWIEVMRMKIGKTSMKDVIGILFKLFTHYGIAEEIVSDNGHQFISDEFEQWCTRQGICHLCSAPYQQQSNGQVERFVKTFKGAMNKMEEEGGRKEDVHLRLLKFLQRYRIVPHPLTDQAPTILFLNCEP
uniref:RNA-directed DNA polymerase n=1 Tax=Plectus sambesii TaxID=2011161 RepID=A0A914VIB5_9BILA